MIPFTDSSSSCRNNANGLFISVFEMRASKKWQTLYFNVKTWLWIWLSWDHCYSAPAKRSMQFKHLLKLIMINFHMFTVNGCRGCAVAWCDRRVMMISSTATVATAIVAWRRQSFSNIAKSLKRRRRQTRKYRNATERNEKSMLLSLLSFSIYLLVDATNKTHRTTPMKPTPCIPSL